MAVCTASVVTPAPPTAGRKVKICASMASRIGRRLCDAGAGRDQLHRRHRLDQKVGHAHLHQAAGQTALEPPRHHNNRRPLTDTLHQPFERFKLRLVVGIDIGDDDARAADIELTAAGSVPRMTSRPICVLPPKVARTDCSNASSAVTSITLALGAALPDRPMRIIQARMIETSLIGSQSRAAPAGRWSRSLPPSSAAPHSSPTVAGSVRLTWWDPPALSPCRCDNGRLPPAPAGR